MRRASERHAWTCVDLRLLPGGAAGDQTALRLLTSELLVLLEDFGVHGGRHHVLGSDVLAVRSSKPLLQGLEVHRRQGGPRAAIDAGEGLQHLHGWESKRALKILRQPGEKKNTRGFQTQFQTAAAAECGKESDDFFSHPAKQLLVSSLFSSCTTNAPKGQCSTMWQYSPQNSMSGSKAQRDKTPRRPRCLSVCLRGMWSRR